MTFEPVPDQPTWTRVLKVVAVGAAIVLAAVIIVGGASFLGRTVGDALGPPDAGEAPVDVEPGVAVTVEIPPGSSGQDIGAILAAQGVVRSALEFEVAVRNVNAAQRLQAGTYELTTLMDPADVVAELVSGPAPAVYRVTVIEGLRVNEILTGLAEKTPHDYEAFETALLDGSVSTSLVEMPDEPTLTDWEGLLFPDTYEFASDSSPEAILQRLASTMEQRVNSIDWAAWESLGYTVYQGIILASLIETEVLLDDERPIVSSVIHNRLAQDMALDIDATVLYALGTRDIALFDREVDSPYNTYRVAGLPPTPIAAPGRASLEAAAAPATTPFLFYVLSDNQGHHVFAETLEEHNANVAKAREDGVLP
ncbi:MAG TPA: endolytic transglycosylase MltG [Acidimicrobiia bacterium]|nr:endolytic transglycosylase MltG [Acidimicrobiia bacterium]